MDIYDIFKIPNKLKNDNVLNKQYDITILYNIRNHKHCVAGQIRLLTVKCTQLQQ